MTEDVFLPLWLIIIGGAFAAWAVLDHLILPVWRWFFKRRTRVVIKEINERLDLLTLGLLGEHQAARESFERALAADPELELDAGSTSPKIRRVFEDVRGESGSPGP